MIAEVEDLEKTLSRFPDLSRDALLAMLRGEKRRSEPAPTPAPSGLRATGLVQVWSDGASRGNPGPAAIGVVLKNGGGKLLAERGQAIGRRTNNYAEYEAVRYALECAAHLGAEQVIVRADSELVVRQLTGVYRVKHADLRPLFEAVKRLESRFPKGVSYQHVPREENRDADRLANEALDEAGDVF